MVRPRVYLAGPAVFLVDAKKALAAQVKIAARYGLDGVPPALDVDLTGLDGLEAARGIRAANIARIRSCQGIIACVTPFRGPDPDPGTLWEAGFAEGFGMKIALWREDAPGDLFGRHVAESFAGAAEILARDFGVTA